MNSNRTPLYIIGSIVVVAIIGVIAYAVSQNNTASAPDTPHESNTNQDSDAVTTDQVKIANYAFSPATITVKAGTKVTWTNKDSVKHTVTSDDGAPDTIDSGLFGKDENFSFTFTKAGTYHYFCEPHPYMKGTVIVTE